MVARIVTGQSIKGAVNYNEKKAAKGKAELILAQGYLKNADQLTFADRLTRLENLAKKNERVRTNCVHISLNFEPKEVLSDEKLVLIAKDYMQKIDLGDQPFLVYRHFDAAHAHVHIVTTNIKCDGIRIPLHNIGLAKSEPIRKALETKYGLVSAEGRGQHPSQFLKPADVKAATYGKSETKTTISNIVRTIVRSYKFTSIEELNAILNEYNVIADRGEPGSKMYENKGLVYAILNTNGEKTGVPIKASTIYTKPTLRNLEERFKANIEARKSYRDTLKRAIEGVLADPLIKDRVSFSRSLKKQGIDVVFRENSDRVYGVTFIDHRSKVVFKGSDLDKQYSAAGLLACIERGRSIAITERQANTKVSTQVFNSIDYKQGVAYTIAQLYSRDLRIKLGPDGSSDRFYIGTKQSSSNNYAAMSKKMEAYFGVNGVTPNIIDRINGYINDNQKPGNPVVFLSPAFLSFLQILLREQQLDHAYAVRPTKRRKRKR